MALITRLSRLSAGFQRGIDLTTNTMVVGDITIGGTGGTNLTKTILDRLVSLQDGSNVDASYHVHNDTTIPYTRVDGSKKDIQAASDDVGSALNDLDDDKISKTGSIAFTGDQPMGTHKLTGLSAGSTAGDSVRYEQAILASGVNDFAADQSFGGNRATNLADPSSGQDAVTLSYMSARLAGIKPKDAVRAASTANIDISSALIDSSTVDGVVLATGDRVLLKDQTAPAENGIYIVAASGAASRSTDMDSLSPIDEVNGAWVSVQEGTTQAGQIWVQFGTVATLDTDALNFEYFNPIAGLIGGDMITFAGSTFSVDLATTSGLESSNPGNVAGKLRVKLEASNPSLQINGSNELGAKLDAAGAISSGASGLAVGVDGSTIEINTNALRVKDAGITTAKLAANAVDESKIRLTNTGTLRARNAADSSDVDLFHLDASDVMQFDLVPQMSGTPSNANDIVNKAYVDASSGQKLTKTVTVGEAMAANTSFLVRWAVNGETAGRLYKADNDATSADNFLVAGVITVGGSSLSAGNTATMNMVGEQTLGSSDTPFGSTDVGLPVYLGSSGAWLVGQSNAPTADSSAIVMVGIVKSTSVLDMRSLQVLGVN